MPALRPWEAEQPLTELTFWADWDNVTSMALSLRMQLFEHGSIPVWNYMFCGGRPELAVPYSWAYTWPSLFAYLLPPIYAVLALWLLLSALGGLSTRALLLRWSGSQAGANAGALVYVLCGVFAARFNAGHLSFAFFHLVPLLMLLFERGFERALAGRRQLGVSACACAASFLFMTAALPHPLMHFFPAFLLMIAYRVVGCAISLGWLRALRAASLPLTATLLGVWLAAYKLWPVVRWQAAHPRRGVHLEANPLAQVFLDTTTLMKSFEAVWREGSHYPIWEYHAFVGPLPWLLAGIALLGSLPLRGQSTSDEARARRRAAGFGLLLAGIGVALALGNAHPFGPAQLFRYLPLLDGVRAFSRYQILVVFGLAILVSLAFPIVCERVRGGWPRRALQSALTLAIGLPLGLQAGYAIWDIRAQSNREIASRYPPPPQAGAPIQIWNARGPLPAVKQKTALLERGYWIANCLSNITLPEPLPIRRAGSILPLSVPRPIAIGPLTANRLELHYPAEQDARLFLNLRVLPGFEVDAPVEGAASRRYVESRSLTGGTLAISASYPGPFEGACASGLGLGAAALFFTALWRRERPHPDTDRAS